MLRSPWGIPYRLSIPVGLEGVLQSMVTSFLRHWSISTVLKNATDWGRSFRPSLCANMHLKETRPPFNSRVPALNKGPSRGQGLPTQLCSLSKES